MSKQIQNRGICPKCKHVVAVSHVEHNGKMYLSHQCPECGTTESLISSDAERWSAKRELCQYRGEAENTCSLRCMECNHGKSPTLVFLDVTNRCNMNCPICLANLDAMGFCFNPPMEYFKKVFQYLSQHEPKPRIQLFGGEPTCREDLVDIINCAAEYGLSARIVTNGIRFANEEYCKKILATGTQLMFAFDGRSPDIYQKLRNNPRAYDIKLKGLANVKKHYTSKVTIMCCAGIGVNEDYMGDLIEFCHENKDFIAALDLIPLAETWGPEKVDAGDTTIEDVERMIRNALPGTEFVPAGILYKFKTYRENFNIGRLTFGGAHPNCEMVTALLSDGTRYRPLSDFLKHSIGEVTRRALEKDEEMEKKIHRNILCKMFGKRGRQALLVLSLIKFILQNVNLKAVFGDKYIFKILKFIWGLIRGKEAKTLFRTYTTCHHILRMIILPFEEPRCVESARLVECPASFAYEHPITNDIHLMPVCSWAIYKDGILRATAAKYGDSSSETTASSGV